MSRAYRIAITESLRRHIQVEDGVASSLELLPILSKDRMEALLAQALEERGFVREGTALRRPASSGIVVSISLDTGQVSVVAQGHADLELSAQRNAVTDQPVEKQEQVLRKAARASLEATASAEEEALRRAVTTELEGVLRELRPELDAVVNQVTQAALKARAAELGHIEEIREEPNGGLTIKVRI